MTSPNKKRSSSEAPIIVINVDGNDEEQTSPASNDNMILNPAAPAPSSSSKRLKTSDTTTNTSTTQHVSPLLVEPHPRSACPIYKYDAMDVNQSVKFCSECLCEECNTPAAQCSFWLEHCLACNTKMASSSSTRVSNTMLREAQNTHDCSSSLHFRHKCPVFDFDSDNLYSSVKFCENCMCSVCNVAILQCPHWLDHCLLISNSDPDSNSSYDYDDSAEVAVVKDKDEKENPNVVVAAAMEEDQVSDLALTSTGKVDQSTFLNPEVDDNEVLSGSILSGSTTDIKIHDFPVFRKSRFLKSRVVEEKDVCRRCGTKNPQKIYLRESANYYQKDAGYNEQWCGNCGRVPFASCFVGETKQYTPFAGDYVLPEKTIPFRIHPHDPRNFQDFDGYWEKRKQLFSIEEMSEDTFRSRIGHRPDVRALSRFAACVIEEKIPTSGVVFSRGGKLNGNSSVHASECSAMILRRRDTILLQELERLKGAVNVNISAVWDAKRRAGYLHLKCFIAGSCFDNAARRHNKVSLLNFVSSWTDQPFFSLKDLKLLMKAQFSDCDYVGPYESSDWKECIHVPEEFDPNSEELDPNSSDDRTARVRSYNKDVTTRLNNLDFLPSVYNRGGICSYDISFQGVLKRCLSESLMAGIRDYYSEKSLFYSWKANQYGLVSDRRRPIHENFYLNHKDQILLLRNIPAIYGEYDNPNSGAEMMSHIESLGHHEAPTHDGLNVELRGYQRQSVAFALHREKMIGGIQNFWWTKLPGTELFYSPALNKVSISSPKRVRGGFICEEMGLGKTVISLSIILQHPAPLLPESGSIAASAHYTEEGWSTLIKNSSTSPEYDMSGSILSRGTLVVCPVSLVGQWVSEARSKLRDPGLIYEYYGPKRTRDPMELSKKSIVVTTYDVLASDFTRQSKGGKWTNPTCQSIKWWRVIVDESHNLKGKKRYESLASIEAENRWCVTGTPINTSLNDLKNQLAFLGIEDSSQLLNVYTTSEEQYRNMKIFCPSKYSILMSVLRSIMIRHSKSQKIVSTGRGLIELPKKVESIAALVFSEQEKQSYQDIEAKLLDFYKKIRVSSYDVSRNVVLLFSKLRLLRIACAGGSLSKEDYEESEEGTNEDELRDCSLCSEQVENPSITHEDNRVNLNVTFRSKIDFVMEKLGKLFEDEKNAKEKSKILIFTQFNSTLDALEAALKNRGMKFRTLRGNTSMKNRATALREFESTIHGVDIFLLSLRSGGVGINLTSANKVFVMEPSMNPALEQQAIGRVHRMGQRRNVEITRLVMRDSVEQRLLESLNKHYGTGTLNSKEDDDTESTPTAINLDHDNSSDSENSNSRDDEQDSEEYQGSKALQIVGNLQQESKSSSKYGVSDFDLFFGYQQYEG